MLSDLKMNGQGSAAFLLLLWVSASQIALLNAVCEDKFRICVTTKSSGGYHKPYKSLEFPDLQRVFKADNVSYEDIRQL